jgi:O-antigen ligase
MTSVWRCQDVVPGFSGLSIPLVVSCATVAVFLLDASPDRRLKSLRSPLTWFLLLLCVQLVIASMTGLNLARSRSFLLRDFVWSVVTFILVSCVVRRVRELRWLVAVSILGAATYSAFVLLRFRALDNIGRLCCTPYYDANDISLVLVSTIPYLFFFLRDAESTKVRLFTLGALCTILPTFQLAGSRGGFLGLMVVVVLALFFYKGIKPSKRVWSVVTAVAVLFVLGGAAYREKIVSIFRPEDDYNMTDEEGRVAMWKAGIALTRQRPATGYGPRSFGEAYGTYSPRAIERGGAPWRAAHSAYVELAAEAGVPAILLFVGMLLSGIALSWRVRSRALDPRLGSEGLQLAMLAQSNAMGLVGYVVTSVFLSSEYLTIIYFMLGMTVVLSKLLADLEAKAPGAAAPQKRRVQRGHAQPLAQRGRAWPVRA